MSDFQNDTYAADADAHEAEALQYSPEDMLDCLDEESTDGLTLQSLLTKGLYVVKIGRVVPEQAPGQRAVKGFKVLDTSIVYDITNGKHMNRPIMAYEWLIGKNGNVNPEADKTKGAIYSSLAVAFPYADEGWAGSKKELNALKAEALSNIRNKVEGYTPGAILRNAQDFYAIGWIKLEEASGDYDASNKLNLQSLEPITPTLLGIIMRHAQGADA